MNSKQQFKWQHFPGEIILLCLRWYLRYPLSYRNLSEIMLERGLSVDHTTIYRWAMAYASEIEKRSRKYLNNIIKQDHRFAKKLAKYKSYFQYFHTAWRTLRGYEIINGIRKAQVINIDKGDILGPRNFVHSLLGIAAL